MTVRKPWLRVMLVVASLDILCACAHMAPGLNIPEGEEGVHPFSTPGQIADKAADKSEWPPYGPNKVPPLPSAIPETQAPDAKIEKYEVVRVTPAVVARLRLGEDSLADDPTLKLPAVSPADVPPEYKIGPGDVLFVTVWEHPELTQPVSGILRDAEKEGRLVASDGSMYYPYVGTFHVAGMTCPEAREFISQHLTDAVVDPKVDIRVVAYRAYRVQVTGEVKNPGTVTLDDMPKGLLQAIDSSGGLTPEASRRRAILIRKHKSYRLDLANLISGDAPARNLTLQPGDEIHIPNRASDKVFVLGEVTQQQPVLMQETTMPLVEALTVSGGLAKLRANDSGVLIFRINGVNSDIAASVYALDMATPEGMLLASQFPLNARDIVYVKATAFAQYNSVVEQILPTVQTVFFADRIVK